MITHVQTGDIRTPPVISGDVKATLVYTDAGLPLAVFLQQDDLVMMHTAKDDDFTGVLEKLGFDKRKLPDMQVTKVDHLGHRV